MAAALASSFLSLPGDKDQYCHCYKTLVGLEGLGSYMLHSFISGPFFGAARRVPAMEIGVGVACQEVTKKGERAATPQHRLRTTQW